MEQSKTVRVDARQEHCLSESHRERRRLHQLLSDHLFSNLQEMRLHLLALLG